jgi:hypothetical protein
MRKTLFIISGLFFLGCASLFASPKADGFSFCAEQEFSKPVKYVAVKDANIYFDAYPDDIVEQAKSRGGVKKIKKGATVDVYAVGKNCNGGKTIFMNTDGVGFTGVKANDFKKVD